MLDRVLAFTRIPSSPSSSSGLSPRWYGSNHDSWGTCSPSASTTTTFFSPSSSSSLWSTSMSLSSSTADSMPLHVWATSASSSFSSNNNNNNNNSSSLGSPKYLQMRHEHRSLLGIRTLCQDRRGALDHFQLSALIKNAIRVTVQQGALIYSNFMSDQLKHDMALEEDLQKGNLSSHEAEQQTEEWNEKEWDKRWKVFPERLLTAYLKYHAVTAIMRFYEFVASRTLSMIQLDTLTLDPFAATRRRTQSGEPTATPSAVARECWDANLIAYLSDYTLHQIILTFGYYAYVRNHYRRRPRPASTQPPTESESSSQATTTDESLSNNNSNKDELHTGSLVLSFLKKSTILALSRLVSLSFASIGGAVGSVLIPGGWGVLLGINMGDSVGSQMTEEFVVHHPPSSSTHHHHNDTDHPPK